ncbi:TPA: hypothetical protein VDW53_006145 [Pseudomonas aeruginosa]|uniref:hypothetical protein n=1 Tax=Pseudomonas aeruginosa TaxID=287 RepID=UPI0028CEC400|nr:hypothetical protein [Pseudomonas aeruginosa]MDT8228826.1 hypothetical protein [Pseudomonas aeruginosa]HCK7249540.1 hypothetical protein [Pseudomonas aeruginosa]HEK1406042.1 hypothetical protein [Pseudomonas aeruginosa]HEP8028700.1 hypothetical protein [Pseudomonas aeruginosa]HEP9940130.1 hypothetical protein [Pseudomonas aeruginosa]
MSTHEDLLLQLIQRDPGKIRSILGLPAPKPDLSWYEGAEIWIEAGHRSDRGAELRIAFGGPLPNGYADFWIPFSGPDGSALGWLRFSYITTVREKSLFTASEWRSAGEPAPAEESRLDLPMDSLPGGFAPASIKGATGCDDQHSVAHRASKGIDEHLLVAMADPKVIAAIIQAARIKRFAKIAPLNTQEWAAETERMKAQFSSPAAEESTTPDTLQYIGFSGPQRALLDQLAQYWLRIAAVSKREAEANPNPDRKRGLELRYMAHYNCAAELQNLLQTGELPGHLGFQVLAQKPE